MRMSSGTQGTIFGPADRVMLDGDSAPMIDGVYQAGLAGPAADHMLGLSGSPGDGCDTGQAAQGLIVSIAEGVESF